MKDDIGKTVENLRQRSAAYYAAKKSDGDIRPNGQRVIVQTADGAYEGKVAGRTYQSPCRYIVHTVKGTYEVEERHVQTAPARIHRPERAASSPTLVKSEEF